MNEKDEAAAGALDAINELHDDVERVAAERDQALAEVERLRKGYVDPERFVELCETEAEVERLRAALEKIGHPKVPPWANFTHGDAARWRQEAFVEFGELARRALADNTRASTPDPTQLEADIDIIERALDETNYPPGTQLWIDGHAAVARLAQALGIERVTT